MEKTVTEEPKYTEKDIGEFLQFRSDALYMKWKKEQETKKKSGIQ